MKPEKDLFGKVLKPEKILCYTFNSAAFIALYSTRFTFDQLAKKSGIGKGQLSKLRQAGSNPTLKTLVRLARILKMEPVDFIAAVCKKGK